MWRKLDRSNKYHSGILPLVLLIMMASVIPAKGQGGIAERNYLFNTLRASGFQLTKAGLTQWRKRQKESYLSQIAVLPDSVRQYLTGRADEALRYEWPLLPATLYLEYKQTGRRTGYERRLTERREMLSRLVIGELLTGTGKYLPQVINGLWATLEESTWEIPAIIGLQKAGTDLPDPHESVIGLVSAESGLMVASIQYMLYDQLEAVSPILNKRIARELHRRILDPYLQRDDFWWMGSRGQTVNNWNAWINANVLETGLLTDNDTAELTQLLTKVFRSADHFINQYPEDGGCDEGPSYWSLAGGKLINLLYVSNRLSVGRLDWSSIGVLRRMGTYIIKTHIDRDYFVNFADASPRTVPDPVSVYRFGDLFGDDSLRRFAAYLFALKKNMPPDTTVMGFLETAALYSKLTGAAMDPGLPSFSFLPDLQMYMARSSSVPGSGLFLAVQGGNNGESHNHNDVGNFVIYAKGQPVMIDAGVGTYTAQTFSNRRYELWNMQSQWHNCPLINGVMQMDGKSYRASAVTATTRKDGVEIAMELSKAYPETAYVRRWERHFLFSGNGDHPSLLLSDNYSLGQKTGETRIDFLTCRVVRQDKRGQIGFYDAAGQRMLLLHYSPELMTVRVDEKIMDDEKLIGVWGKKLYRLSFLLNSNVPLQGSARFLFELDQ